MSNAPLRPAPSPLTRSESERIWRFDRTFLRAGAMAVLLLATGLGAAHAFGDSAWIRWAVVAAATGLIVGGLLLQLAARCPRCGTRVGAITLPSACRTCGVEFPRPEHVDSELDN